MVKKWSRQSEYKNYLSINASTVNLPKTLSLVFGRKCVMEKETRDPIGRDLAYHYITGFLFDGTFNIET